MTSTDTEILTQSPGPFRRALRRTSGLILTLGIVTASLLTVLFGSEALTERAVVAADPDPAPITPVATQPIVLAEGYELTRAFIGQVEASRSSLLSAELSGKLTELAVGEGDRIQKGDLIAELDTRLLEAERARLEASKTAFVAQLRFAEQTVERLSRLSSEGVTSAAALDEALSRADELRARIAEVAAGLATNTLQIEKSQVFAPFGGRITQRFVDGGETVAPGQALVEIVEDAAPLVRVGLPLDVAEEALTAVEIEIGDTRYAAKLVTVRPDVDPATRTRTALFRVDAERDLTFGQMARLELRNRQRATGLWVDITGLQEGLRGQWTLLVVDGQNTVRNLSVQVLHVDGDRGFVRGAFPEDAQLISTGPHRVTVGQTVAPQPAG